MAEELGPFDPRGLDELLKHTRTSVDSLGRRQADLERDQQRERVGDALDGAIRAVVADGRVTSIQIAAPAARLGPADLGTHIVRAVNVALTAARDDAVQALPSSAESAELSRQLGDLRDQSMRQMRALGVAMGDVLNEIRAARGQ